MATFEDLKKSLKDLQNSIESCNKDVVGKTSSVSSMIENAFLKNRINEDDYIELKNTKLEYIDRYKDKCVCLNKDRIGIELRNILLKYKYVWICRQSFIN